MSTNKSYVIWNNKGGIGKSTIVSHIASIYAESNLDRDVIIIDLCPQAHSSLMLMGNTKNSELKIQELILKDKPKTVVGYITETILNGNAKLDEYVTHLNSINSDLSSNLYLLSGDRNLETISPFLSKRAETKSLFISDNPWVDILLIIKKLTKKKLSDKPCTFFIDTNPSFSIYTQLAIAGANKLLIPINANDSSISVTSNLFNLIWGTKKHAVYGDYTFAERARKYNLELPKIYCYLINKKDTIHAHEELYNEVINKIYTDYQNNTDKFEKIKENIIDIAKFKNAYTIDLTHFNSDVIATASKKKSLYRQSIKKFVYNL